MGVIFLLLSLSYSIFSLFVYCVFSFARFIDGLMGLLSFFFFPSCLLMVDGWMD